MFDYTTEATGNSKVIFNDAYTAMVRLALLAKVKTTKSLIRKYVSEIKSYPNISLFNMVELIIRCGGTPKVEKKSAADIRDLHLPAIGHLSCDGKSGSYITLISANKHSVTYLGPDNKMMRQNIDEFEKNWSGIVITSFFDEEAHDEDYLVNKAAESEAVRDYRDSITIREDFFTPEECSGFILYCESNSLFNPSTVVSLDVKDEEPQQSSLRTSFSAHVKRNGNDPLLHHIYEKIEKSLHVSPEKLESIQCVRYATGEEFGVHFDGDSINQRKKTVLVYLNDDFQGGETYFPEIDLKVAPKTGSALEFLNLNQDGSATVFSAHCGLPVSSGVKYAMNIWIKR